MLAVAALSATRLAAARSSPDFGAADVDLAHLMGVGMAGMLIARTMTLSGLAGEALFGLLTAWFAWRCLDGGRAHTFCIRLRGDSAVHLSHCATMVYMFAIPRTPDGICTNSVDDIAVGTLKVPASALSLAIVLTACCVKDLFVLLHRPHDLRTSTSVEAVPASDADLMILCRIAMGATMAFMLTGMS